MVLTGPVGTNGAEHSRRRVLATAVTAGVTVPALAGCGLFNAAPELPAAPDPLQPLLDEALVLVAAYDRAIAAQPGLATRLTPLADDHRAHAAELSRVTGKALPSTGVPLPSAAVPPGSPTVPPASTAVPPASATVPPASTGVSLPSAAVPAASAAVPAASANPAVAAAADLVAGLRAAEQAAQKTAIAACRQAPAHRAALVGSIAACRATHAEALR
jgi:hypothetical protein